MTTCAGAIAAMMARNPSAAAREWTLEHLKKEIVYLWRYSLWKDGGCIGDSELRCERDRVIRATNMMQEYHIPHEPIPSMNPADPSGVETDAYFMDMYMAMAVDGKDRFQLYI